MAEKKKYYITTPIYYPSGKWHIGTCYTTVICDALARFKRMQGADVFYLTGTDDHGQKIEKNALESGRDVKEFVDEKVNNLKELWQLLNISYDKFIRTTDSYHEASVQKIFQKLYDQGDIYKSEYCGKYCTPCESFWTESQLVEGKCPDCGRDVENAKEESYFFKLSRFQDRLIKLIEDNTEFLQPKSRQNEMLNNFLRPGLQDLCVSRSTFSWGVKVPFDDKHVIYVWIDALFNYITALGYGSDDETLFKKFWPAEVHLMGKEIVRFHSIIWPALLMALDIPIPQKIYGHGWLLLGSDKISKSKGNIVDPFVLSERYSVDALRYYLLREVPFGSDGMFANRLFLSRINSDLANDFGNLVSRTTAMAEQYYGCEVPQSQKTEPLDCELIKVCEDAYGKVSEFMDKLLVPEALEVIWTIIGRANKYIDETMPWALAKQGDKARLSTVIYNLCEAIRVANVLIQPFLPATAEQVFIKLGINEERLKSFESLTSFGQILVGTKTVKGEALFKRIDIEKELIEMENLARQLADKNTTNATTQEKKIEPKTENVDANANNEIDINDFMKVNLKVGNVVSCEKVEKSDKLLKLSVDLGEVKLRTIVSGIAKTYSAEEMVGKQVVVVANLKPVKLRGILSEGMILCASDDNNKLALISPIVNMQSGDGVR